MLPMDAAKLKWMGIDMRPRWRRRAVVASTYAVFLVGVWEHPRGSYELFLLMGYGGVYFRGFDRALKETFGAVSRWTVSGVVYLSAVWLLWRHSLSPNRPNPMVADMWALLWIAGVSALSYSTLVEPVWMRSSVRRWLRRPRRLHSLDEFARHYFGDSFAALTEEQQLEVGRRERANPMGEWVMGGSGRFPIIEDERVRHEDDRVRAQAQRLMTWLLVGSAVAWSFVTVPLGRSVSGDVLASWSWTLAAVGLTLRQAIVLWTERDPREMSGEMELVEREA